MPHFSEESDFVEFQQFVAKYEKSYPTSDEFNKRFAIFRENKVIAARLQLKDKHAKYGVTQFSDLSQEEFRGHYLIANFTSPKMRGEKVPVLPSSPVPAEGYPVSFDWRNAGIVTGVYNQAQCGSCWAFSTTENIESMEARAGRGLQNLAMQQLVDCSHNGDNGCAGGNPPNAFAYVIATGGIEAYGNYPYTAQDGACQFNPGLVADTIANWGYISTNDDENAMMSWTYANGPPSICVDASTWQYYNGGVITSCGMAIDHCVQLTGWTTVGGTPAWTVRNSWGTGWGYGGYLYVMRNADVCAIGNEVTSCVV
jgi:hypothetical protein